MNRQEQDGEVAIYEAVDGLALEDVHRRVEQNAERLGIEVTDQHYQVIDSLIRHYQTACETDDCLEAHRHMRFLEKEFADQGGSRYLYTLFSNDNESGGVLHTIHKLADLPGLRLDVDKGFGTAF